LPTQLSSSFRSADALLLLVVLVWGADFSVLKRALAVMHPHVANALRFTVSAAVLGTYYSVRCQQASVSFFAPLKASWHTILSLGLLGFGAHQVLFVLGLNNTTAGNAALIMATNPIWTALLSWGLGDEALGLRAWGGFFLSLVGTSLVVAAGSMEVAAGVGTLFGNGMMLLAAMAFGSYTAFSKRVVDSGSPTATAFFGVLFALPVLLGIGALYEPSVKWSQVGWQAWGAILYSGGLAVGLMFVLWNRGVRRVGSSNTAVYYYLVPVVGMVVGAVALGEPVTLAQITGGGLILGGLSLVRRHT
jgi:drug/metabolite transporter (DMT)-like permease